MYCEKCGIPIEEGQRYCMICQSNQPSEEQPAQTGFIDLNCTGETENKESGKGKKFAMIAAVVALAAVLVVLLWNPIANLFSSDKLFETPQEHFAYVEGKNTDALADAISVWYGDLLALGTTETYAQKVQASVSVSDLLMNMVSESAQIDLNWLNDINLSSTTNMDADGARALMSLSIGDTNIVSLDTIVDYAEAVYWLGIPELSNAYLQVNMNEMTGDTGMPQLNREQMQQILKALPDEQVMNKLLRRYLKVAVSGIKDVKSSTRTIHAGDLSQKCTVLEVKIDQEALIDIVIAVLEESKHDKELLAVIGQIADLVEPGMSKYITSDWDGTADLLISQIKASKSDLDSTDYIIMKDYVDSNNCVIGREFLIPGSMDSIRYWTVTDGDEFAYELNVMDVLVLSGSGTDMKGSTNGEFALSVEDLELLTFELINFDSKKFDKGQLCGTVRTRLSQEALQVAMETTVPLDFYLDLKLDTSSAAATTELDFVLNGMELISLSAQSKEIQPVDVQFPKYSVNVTDEAAVEAWVEQFDIEQIMENLKKAGLPAEFLTEVEGLVESA